MKGQRRYERVALFCPVQLTVLPEGDSVSANTFNISVGGVGLIAGVWLERGTPVRVRFLVKNGSEEPVEEDVLGRVAYSLAEEDGNRIGIEFLEILRESAQPALMKKLNML